jgi:hypothetical protein
MKTSGSLATAAVFVSFLAVILHVMIGFDETLFLTCFVCYWSLVLFSFVCLALLELAQFFKENK